MSLARLRLVFWVDFFLLVVPTATAMYLFQPFPGSQGLDSAVFAWYLEKLRPWTEILGGLLLVAGLVGVLASKVRLRGRIVAATAAVLAALVLWLAHVKMAPAAWFLPPATVRFAQGLSAELPASTLVLGVAGGGEARAYPIRLLAYHHRLEDRLGGERIWVTYCTMCRTGKVFRPEAAGRPLTFDLVGAYRYNSVYEDRETGSWWYQANGRALVGPLAGERLPELLADQMTLGEWLALHPDSAVFQPDPAFADGYKRFNFDQFDSRREEPERGEAWQWVIGVEHGGEMRGYAFSALARERVLNDQLGDLPLALVLRPDGISYRVWDRRLAGGEVQLRLDVASDLWQDERSGSHFGFDGVALDGALAGQRLRQLPASLEYRHSLETFSAAQVLSP